MKQKIFYDIENKRRFLTFRGAFDRAFYNNRYGSGFSGIIRRLRGKPLNLIGDLTEVEIHNIINIHNKTVLFTISDILNFKLIPDGYDWFWFKDMETGTFVFRIKDVKVAENFKKKLDEFYMEMKIQRILEAHKMCKKCIKVE